MVGSRFFSRGFGVLALCGLSTLLPLARATEALARGESPAETLHKHGLSRLGTSSVWVTRRELELRQHLAEIPQHRLAIAQLEQAVTDRIAANASEFSTARQAEATLVAALAATRPDDAARRALLARLTALRTQMVVPDRLGEQPEVRLQLMELSSRRGAVWLLIAAVRRNAPLLVAEYKQLAETAEVQAALEKLDPRHKLGPVKDYREDIKKLDEIEKAVLTDWIPVYLQGGRPRVTAILNETIPVTLTWTSSSEPTLLTTAMVEAAGIAIPADAPRQQITPAKGRTYTAQQVTVPKIRFGRHVLRDVEALVLPPEAEDLGAQIGASALSGVHVEAKLERLQLIFSSTR